MSSQTFTSCKKKQRKAKRNIEKGKKKKKGKRINRKRGKC